MKFYQRLLAAALVLLMAFGNLGAAAAGAAEADDSVIELVEQVPAEAAAEVEAAEPAAEEPVAEEPAAEEPVAEEPVAEESVAEEPVAEESVAEEPAAEESVAEEPAAEESEVEETALEPTEEEAPVEEIVAEADENVNEYSFAAEAQDELEEAPAVDNAPGLFQLPGVEVDDTVETEIVRPESSEGEDQNAANGIMPIAYTEFPLYFNGEYLGYLRYEKGWGRYENGNYFEVHIQIDGVDIPLGNATGQHVGMSSFKWKLYISNEEYYIDGGVAVSGGSFKDTYNNDPNVYESAAHVPDGAKLTIKLSSVKHTFTLDYAQNCPGKVNDLPPKEVVGNQPGSTYTFTLSDQKPTRAGYEFVGWALDKDGKQMITDGKVECPADRTVHVYAIWERIVSHTVTYKVTGNKPDDYTVPKSESHKKGENYTVAAVPDASKYTKRDTYGNVLKEYTFDGWYLNGEKVTGKQTMPNENVELTGKWTVKEIDSKTYQHDVSYSVTGDIPEGYTVPETKTYTQGQEYTVEAVPNAADYTVIDEYKNVLKQYTFEGWSLEGTYEMGNADVEITGVWTQTVNKTEKDYTHTVTYSVDGDVPEGYTAPETQTYIQGQEYTVEAVPDASKYTEIDDYGNVLKQYTFEGWSESGTHEMGDANVTITGVWTQTVNKTEEEYQHTVTYEVTGDKPDGYEVPEPETCTAKDTYTVADVPEDVVVTTDKYENVLSKYVFDGWKLDGEKVTALTMPDDNVELTGEWELVEIEAETYQHTVSYSVTGDFPAGYTAPKTETYTKGEEYAVESTPDAVGKYGSDGKLESIYVFTGWLTASGEVVTGKYVMGDENVTYTGKWELQELSWTERDGFEQISIKKEVRVKRGDMLLPPLSSAQVSDTLVYTITVSYVDRAKREVYDVTVRDSMSGRTGWTWKESPTTPNYLYYAGNHFGYPSSKTYTAEYTVQPGDAGKVLTNTATASWRGKSVSSTVSTYVEPVAKTRVTVTVQGDIKEFTYDGGEHSASGYTVTVTDADGNELKDIDIDDLLIAPKKIFEVTKTNAGEYVLDLESARFQAIQSKDYAVTLVVENGKLTINKATLTVTANDADKTYGEKDPTLTYKVDGLVNGETEKDVLGKVTVTRVEGEDVAEYTITPSGEKVPDNYEVNYETGTFTIKPRNVIVTVKGGTKESVYDGTEQTVEIPYTFTVNGKTITKDALYEEYGVTVTVDPAKGKDVGTYPSDLEVTATNKNYDVKVIVAQQGKLIINKAKVTVTADDKTITYGDSLPTLTATVTDKPAKGVEVKYTLGYKDGVTPADAGEYEIVVTEGENPNYDVTVKNGTLTIDQAMLIVTLQSETVEKTYTGEEQEVNIPYTFHVGGKEITEEELLDTYGATVTVTGATAKGEDADTYPSAIKATASSKNYDVKVILMQQGRLVINPAKVTVTAGSPTITYGDPLPELTATVTGNPEKGDEVLYTLGYEDDVIPADAGEYEIVVTEGENPNYDVTVVNGTLTIEPKSIGGFTVEGLENVTYNGASQQTPPTVKDGETILVEGKDYTVSYSENTTDAGTVTVTVTGIGNYEDTANGTYEILRKAVTVTVNAASKTYGENDPWFSAEVDGVVSVARANPITYTFSREPGENVGTYDVTPVGDATQGNYTVTFESGKLTIAPAAVTVTAANASKTYGENDPDFAAKVSGLKRGDKDSVIAYTFSRERGENVGTYDVTPVGGATQGNYTVTFESGTLTIDPAEVTVKAANAAKDIGENDPAFTAKVSGLKRGDADSVITYTFLREAGEGAGTYDIMPVGDREQGNYVVNFENGTLTIRPAADTAPIEIPDDDVPAGDDPADDDDPDDGNNPGGGNVPDDGNNPGGGNVPDDGNNPGGGNVPDDGNNPDGGNVPDGGNNPDGGVPVVNIDEDETPQGDTPEEVDEDDGDEDDEVVEIAEDDVPLVDLPDSPYTLSEEEVITEDETPLAGGPKEQECCALHFILMLCALGVTVYYTYDRKRRQTREFELRTELQ